MAVTPHDKARDKEFSACTRDAYGFEVNREFLSLHQRFSPLWAEEEAERSRLWAQFFEECQGPASSPEADTELLQGILSQYGSSAGAAHPSPRTAARLQQLRALVQAGVPMASRGKYWQLFLGTHAKRQAGLYEELVMGALSRQGEDESPRYAAEAQLGEAAAAAQAAGAPGEAAGASPTKCGAKAWGAGGRSGPLQGVGSLGLPVVELLADSSTPAAARAVGSGSCGGVGAHGDPAAGGLEAEGAVAGEAGFPQHHTTLTITLDDPGLLQHAPAALDEDTDEPGLFEAEAADTSAAVDDGRDGAVSHPEAGESPAMPTGEGDSGGGRTSLAAPPSAPVLSLAADSSAASGGSPTPDAGNNSPAASDGYASNASSGGGSACWRLVAWHSKDWLGQIDKDLHRTFPGHPLMDISGRAILRRILAAYARHNPAVGYCQGMNFIAAAFMLFMGEEEAFWCLAAVVEDLLPGYFHMHMVAPQVDQQVFCHLLQGGFPTVWAHLQALEVDVSSVTMHWFLCMFINSLPLESCLRVWDMIFFEGSATVLFRVALALVDVYHKALLECRECSDAYMLLQSMGPMSFDSSRLLDTACIGYGHIRDSALRVLRSKYRPAILEQMRDSFGSDEEFSEYERYFNAAEAVHSRSHALADALARGPTGAAATAADATAAADLGHLTSGSSRASSPGAKAGERPSASASAAVAQTAAVVGGGGQVGAGEGAGGRAGRAPSPLERLLSATQAVSTLTAQLVPSSLPPLLPSGALDARGEEKVREAQAPAGLSLAAVPGLLGGLARKRTGAGRRRSEGSQLSGAETAQGSGGGAPQGPGMAEGLLRRISTLRRGSVAGDSSPTSQQSHSAASGASLVRATHATALTPFSDPALLGKGEGASGAARPTTGSPFREQEQEQQEAQREEQQQLDLEGREEQQKCEGGEAGGPLPLARTPLRPLPRPATLAVEEPGPLDFRSPLRPRSLPHGSASRAPAGPPHRRSHSMLPPITAASSDPRQLNCRKRSFLPDIHRLAQFVPDFAQPAVAAAYRIASNPSPRPHYRPGDPRSPYTRTPLHAAMGSGAAARSGGSDAGSNSSTQQASEGRAAGEGGPAAAAAAAAGEEQGLACDPVRVLRFWPDEEGEVHSSGSCSLCSSSGELCSQSGTAPATSPPAGDELWAQQVRFRRYTHGDAGLEDSGLWPSLAEDTTPWILAHASPPGAAAAAAGSEAGRGGEVPMSVGSTSGSTGSCSNRSGVTPAAGPSPLPGGPLLLETPLSAQRLLAQHPPTPNTGSQLLAVVEFLQQEVATTESRRHAAELAARQGSDTSQQLRRKLEKLEMCNTEKEHILVDMNARVGALTGEVCELEGELCAARMAAQQLQQQVEQRQQQVVMQDELIRVLMDMACTL